METKLELVHNAVIEKFEELKRDIRDMKNEVTADLSNLKSEFASFKREVSASVELNKQRLDSHQSVLTSLAKSFEAHDRILRRNNSILKGFPIAAANKNMLQEVNDFFLAKFGQAQAALEVIPLGPEKSWILVKFSSLDIKQKIMANKAAILRGSRISLGDDLIKSEQVIMAKVHARVRAERQLGRQVKIGHLKFSIDGQWQVWSEETNNFVSQPPKQTPSASANASCSKNGNPLQSSRIPVSQMES